jgi:glycosyltransferase involved in cell wall biosynthesis
MKLIVQIPCYNEEETLPLTLSTIPRKIAGIDVVEVLIIDDGCTDRTVEVARQHGVEHVVRLPGHKGLGSCFQAGIEASLQHGADIIVNTDADNQYPQQDIPRLIEPILEGQADMVIGARPIGRIEHFSLIKRIMQKLGSWAVRLVSGTTVPDATSGFRAFSRGTALNLCVMTRFSYTLDTIIQAGKKNLRVASVPIEVNDPTRPSRLMKGMLDFMRRQGITILRLYVVYQPLRTFVYLSVPFLLVGSIAIARFLILWAGGESGFMRHVQSIVIGGTFLTIGFMLVVLGILADLIATNRARLEELIFRVKRMDLQQRQRLAEEEARRPAFEDELIGH